MGLDVIFTRDNEAISWDNPITYTENGFPFKRITEEITYTRDYVYDIIDTFEYIYIPEICGMVCIGKVTFRGRSYSDFLNDIGLSYDFYRDLTSEELLTETMDLAAWLKRHVEEDGNVVYCGESLLGIRNLLKLLEWAILNKLGTIAGN